MGEVEDQREWIARLGALVVHHWGTGAQAQNVDVALGGGSNRTWFFDVVEASGTRRRAVLRQETATGPLSPFLDPESQYRIVQRAHAAGVPVPEPLFLLDERDGLGRGFGMERVDGETIPRKILRDPEFKAARPRLASQCGEILARIHRIDPAPLGFLAALPESRDPVATQRRRLDDYREPHPALELGFRWLETHRPAVAPRTLVHGDFRNGNFIVGPEGIRAVLDWECCHLGDPLEDHGWLCTRSWRFGRVEAPVGGFGDRETLCRSYEAAGGLSCSPEQIRYWEIFGLVRWAVINVWQAYGHVHEGRRSVVYAACGRNACEIEYDLLRTLDGSYD